MRLPADLRWKPAGRTLGEGRQASVIAVTDEANEFSGQYALKALASGKPPIAYERFAREIEAIKSLSHPVIARIVDHSQPSDSFQFYVMPLEEGAVSLRKLLHTPNNPFHARPLAALDLFVQLMEGIQACEAARIVHRDLSPANVLVLPNQHVRIIDFGLCHIEGAERITLDDEGVGTINYIAPECESGAGGTVMTCADIYAAGKILWAAITNCNAFARESPAFTTKTMRATFPDDPAAWHLHHIFERTLRHKVVDRFPNAADALAVARRVRYLICSGYPPLELINERCPICGWGRFAEFQGSHMVFGNPNPSGIWSAQCSYCGFCFAVNRKNGTEVLQRRGHLS